MSTSLLLPSDVRNSEGDASLVDDHKFNTSTLKPRKIKRPTRNTIADTKASKSFLMEGIAPNTGIPEYNPLKDKHLQYHFYNKKLRKLLRRNGLLTKKDQIIEKKTCLNGDELSRRSPSPDSDTKAFKPLSKGTLLIGFQLPPIKMMEVTQAQNKIRSISVKPAYKDKYGPNSLRNPIVAVDMSNFASENSKREPTGGPLQTQATYATNEGQYSTRKVKPGQRKPFKHSQTQVTSVDSSHIEFGMYTRSQVNRSVDFEKSGKPLPKITKKLDPFMPKIKAHSKTPLVANLNELKPLSKNELQAVFDKFKTRVHDETIVTELPDKEDGRESPLLPGLRKHPLARGNPQGRSRSVIPGEKPTDKVEIKAKRYPSPDPVQRKITEQKVSFRGGKVPWRRIGYQDTNPSVTQKTEGSNIATKTPGHQESLTPKNPFEEKLKWEDADRTTTERNTRVKSDLSSAVDASQLSEALSKLNPRPEAKVENKSTKSHRS